MIQHPLPPFAHGQALKQAYRLLQSHKGLYGLSVLIFVLILLCVCGVYFSLEHLSSTPTPTPSPWLALGILLPFSILYTYLTLVLQVRVLRITARGSEEGAQVSAYRVALRKLLPLILLALLIALVSSLGLLLFIVPGLYLVLRLAFLPQVYIEQGGLWRSVKEAWRLTDGHFYPLLLLLVIQLALSLLGGIALGLGVILTLPLGMLYHTLFYRYLQGVPSEEIHEAIS